ncbi:hypothetical protein JCM19231_4045 [Vibrio ishigakensis]|uniref:Uncharacterized protein n=1 Tax=Vibrio ishigakensis TaxID=1481914 RepID=A0A0B8NZD4_9VIBR|nr:hypothetical protein JCM19231_4045 [Vibrio ishigakensis]
MAKSMSNKKLTLVLCGATLAMFGFGFAWSLCTTSYANS